MIFSSRYVVAFVPVEVAVVVVVLVVVVEEILDIIKLFESKNVDFCRYFMS